MAAGLAKIKRRISSIDSTRKITNAMELVSSVKLMRKRKAMDNTVEYTASLGVIIHDCLNGMKEEERKSASPLLLDETGAKGQGNLYIAVTSSLGLCGGYNINLIKFLEPLVQKDDQVMIIGTKGLSKLSEDKINLDIENISLLDEFSYVKARRIRAVMTQTYLKGNFKAIYLVYTKFKNSLTFVPTAEKILPIQGIEQIGANHKEEAYPPDFVPDRKTVFELLVPKYLDSVLFERFTEAMVCEEGSRRNAMENATDNADDLHKSLNIIYNKARQAEITSQITEIMTGRLVEEE
ncbi:MAG: ATP synthase F1 subunit gamma [Bacilli bacterium]|jgi:F-type H+-transporting ATPase subunit gamma|nr:ATP synthase F1 subunit gamma [Bacilli bacterium]